MLDIDKYALWALKYLIYNCQISGLFIVNILLDLAKFYISEKNIKKS